MYDRIVVVTRRTRLEELIARFNTRGQARFYIEHSAQGTGDFEEYEREHDAYERAVALVHRATDVGLPRHVIDRDLVPTYTFGERDVVVAVGQDGLVANVAKYLDGQPVIGINPEPDRNPGVLVPHPASGIETLLAAIESGSVQFELRTMVEASLDDGQRLVALNEIFLGHPSHQSARYRLFAGDAGERQSSSGLIVSTGTGATGWCRSISQQSRSGLELPRPDEDRLAWFVREAWPSPATGTTLVEGELRPGDELRIVAETDGLVVFGDGIESDRLTLGWGQEARLRLAGERLRLAARSQTRPATRSRYSSRLSGLLSDRARVGTAPVTGS